MNRCPVCTTPTYHPQDQPAEKLGRMPDAKNTLALNAEWLRYAPRKTHSTYTEVERRCSMMDPAEIAKFWALVDALHRAANEDRAYNFISGRLLEEQAADAISELLAKLGHYRNQPT